MNVAMVMMLIAALFGGAAWALYIKDEIKKQRKGQSNALYIVAIMGIGVIVHFICAMCYRGFGTDMDCFTLWSDRIFKDGIGNFYTGGGFHDYPPGYVYVMYVLGAGKKFFDLTEGGVLWLWMKLPSIIADMIGGWLVYKLAKRSFSDAVAAVFAGFLVLNPTVIINSSTWGQVDSILALFCLLAVYFTAERKFIPAFFCIAAGVLIKPQAAFFAPIIIFGLIDELFIRERFTSASALRLLCYIGWAAAAVAAMFITFMPFGSTPIEGIQTIIGQYIETLGEYNYATVNAFNMYAAFGLNWKELTPFLSVIGYGMYAVVIAGSAFLFFKSKQPSRHYIAAFVLMLGIFMLTVKMHERYAYPGIFMLIFALVMAPSLKTLISYGLFSAMMMYNMAWVLFKYDAGSYYSSTQPTDIQSAGIMAVFIFIVCVVLIYTEFTGKNANAVADVQKPRNNSKQATANMQLRGTANYKNGRKGNMKKSGKAEDEKIFELSEPKLKLSRWDFIAMAAITVVYGVIALYNLGNMYAPDTEAVLSRTPLTVDLGSERMISSTEYFLGARQLDESRAITIEYSDEGNNVSANERITSGSVFYWNTVGQKNVKARYVRLYTDHVTNPADPTDNIYIKELCLLDETGRMIIPENANDGSIAALFDEQWKFEDGKSYMSETYFDEIYHARTAYEFLHNMTVYEWTHPPLGKVFIGWGILACGMNPFGWRIVGTLFGIFMVPLIYLFARRMFKETWLAVVLCLLFSFDFMHFTQTRIATIDVYVTFFVMLMYFFMYKYSTVSFFDTPLIKTLVPLGICGISFGFAVASKWTGLYAGVGLFVIFLAVICMRYVEYMKAVERPRATTSGINHKLVSERFGRDLAITIAFCVVMFIMVPVIIYYASYSLYFKTPSANGLSNWQLVTKNANDMLTYHGKTVVNSTHPYSSHWYEWPIMYRPLWYFSNTTADGLKQGISAFGNPAVWWLGIGAVAFALAITITVPLRKRGYFGLNKYVFGAIYAAIFAIFMIWAKSAGAGNEKLERLFPCVALYSGVMVGMFMIVLAADRWIKADSVKIPAFLLVAYFSQLVPWIPIARTTYIYHYFPMVAFTVLMIGYVIKTIYDSVRSKDAVIAGAFVYAAIAILLFVLFYPVISGQPVSESFVKGTLKWFKSWQLIP